MIICLSLTLNMRCILSSTCRAWALEEDPTAGPVDSIGAKKCDRGFLPVTEDSYC